MHAQHHPSRRLPLLVLVLLVGATSLVGLTTATAPVATAATTSVVHDGSTSENAAASCWEVKQVAPNAPSGVYWLDTPQLGAPRQFYCDQTTDGGGWVLVGRGREGWTDNYNGKGTSDEVEQNVTGTAAFAPKQLDANVINDLLGGKSFNSVTDGVRVRRATNQAGTTWQETKWTYATRDRWTWSFGAGLPLSTVTMGSVSGTKLTTYEFGSDQAYNRLWTYQSAKNNWTVGFNFGQNAIGSTSSTSYIYSNVSGGYYGTPFTQVFIRPKVLQSDLTWPSIPSSGTAKVTAEPIAENGALTQNWGVTGTGAGGTSELGSEVQAFAQIGNVMYVGGNFTNVQKGAGATGADNVAQSYLAAFDATTGDWISTFRPTLNNQVKSLKALPNGELAVGGEFTSYDGSARSGLVVVDPSTGTLDSNWTTDIQNNVTGGKVSVRSLDTDGTYLYLGGSFTHLVKGTSKVYARNLARIKLSTGTADATWEPVFNGTVDSIDVSDDDSQVYASGYFTTYAPYPTTGAAASTPEAASVSTAAGAPLKLTWSPTFSTASSARYQQAVKQVGNLVWLGGSQHSMFGYSTSDLSLQASSVMKAGGDVQAIGTNGTIVYGGCHCGDFAFQGTTSYDNLVVGAYSTAWTEADKIYYVGAWDAATGDYAPDFTPTFKARNGMGAWAITVASDGTLWTGGTFTSAVKENGVNQWVGGFARFAERPTTAPDAPSDEAVTLSGSTAHVSWTKSDTSGVTYEVLRNDRVVASTTSTSLDVPGSSSSDQFFVRATDEQGNYSASTSGVTPTAVDALLPAGSTWSYSFDPTYTPPSTWTSTTFDASAWKTGAAPLGFGTSGPITTNIDVPSGTTRPLTSYYRTSFQVTDPSAYSAITLTTRADDGIVVYVNGQELTRSNMPTGTITSGTYATAAPSTATAIANPVTATIPASMLVAGTNIIAVEVHSNYRTTPNDSMDLSIVGTK